MEDRTYTFDGQLSEDFKELGKLFLSALSDNNIDIDAISKKHRQSLTQLLHLDHEITEEEANHVDKQLAIYRFFNELKDVCESSQTTMQRMAGLIDSISSAQPHLIEVCERNMNRIAADLQVSGLRPCWIKEVKPDTTLY